MLSFSKPPDDPTHDFLQVQGRRYHPWRHQLLFTHWLVRLWSAIDENRRALWTHIYHFKIFHREELATRDLLSCWQIHTHRRNFSQGNWVSVIKAMQMSFVIIGKKDSKTNLARDDDEHSSNFLSLISTVPWQRLFEIRPDLWLLIRIFRLGKLLKQNTKWLGRSPRLCNLCG